MSTVMDYLRWYQESDADGDTMDTAELAVAYAKHCLSEELREVWAIHKAEIDALKAQNAALLAAQQWQPIESAPTNQRVLIIDEFLAHQAVACRKIGGHWKTHSNTPEGVWLPKFWQPLPPPPAIAKARGDL